MTHTLRLVVLISGNGSNLQAIFDACRTGELNGEVAAVISNLPDAYGLERARHAGLPAVVLSKTKDVSRVDYDRRLADIAEAYQPDWMLIGWLDAVVVDGIFEPLSRARGQYSPCITWRISWHPCHRTCLAGLSARADRPYR